MHSWLEWDEEKARANYRKHGISFEEAVEVFNDPYHIEYYDEAHSTFEEKRYCIIGRIKRQLVVLVVYTTRGKKYRLISARRLKKHERRRYYDR